MLFPLFQYHLHLRTNSPLRLLSGSPSPWAFVCITPCVWRYGFLGYVFFCYAFCNLHYVLCDMRFVLNNYWDAPLSACRGFTIFIRLMPMTIR
jgi:hypothetical protein